MSCFATEEAEVLLKMMSVFFIGELAIFAEFGAEVQGPLWSTGGVQAVGLGAQVLGLLVIGVGTRTGLALVIGMVVLDMRIFSRYFGAPFLICNKHQWSG